MSNVQETASKFIYPAESIISSNNKSPAKRQQELSSAANGGRASAIWLKSYRKIRIKKPEQIKAHGSPNPTMLGTVIP